MGTTACIACKNYSRKMLFIEATPSDLNPAMITGKTVPSSSNSAMGMYEILKTAARVGKLWACEAGSGNTPLYAATMRAGDFIVDTYNRDLYIVDSGAVVKINL
jgi:hypothetical protein